MSFLSADTSRDYISKVIMPLVALVALLSLSAIGGTFWIADYQTDQAVRQQARLASGGLRVHGEKLGVSAKDYGFWDDAVAAIVEKRDMEWITSNIGEGGEKSLGADMSFVIDPDRKTIYSRILGTDGVENPDTTFKHGFKEAWEAWKRLPDGAVYSGRVPFHSGAAILAIAPIRSWSDSAKPSTGYALVFVQIVDKAMLEEMSRDYELKDLDILGEGQPAVDKRATVSIYDEDGHEVSRLAWRPARPGDELLKIALPFLALFLIVLTALGAVLLLYSIRAAQAIGESNLRASTDALTGLLNRRAFTSEIQRAIGRISAGSSELALFYIDLDGFKAVNDTHGHLAGDELLLQVADRLANCAGDFGTVARLGGDEFAILMPQRPGLRTFELVARTILRDLAQPFTLNVGTVGISASLGITLCGDRTTECATLVDQADSALYRAKAAGKNRYQLFGSPEPRPGRKAA